MSSGLEGHRDPPLAPQPRPPPHTSQFAVIMAQDHTVISEPPLQRHHLREPGLADDAGAEAGAAGTLRQPLGGTGCGQRRGDNAGHEPSQIRARPWAPRHRSREHRPCQLGAAALSRWVCSSRKSCPQCRQPCRNSRGRSPRRPERPRSRRPICALEAALRARQPPRAASPPAPKGGRRAGGGLAARRPRRASHLFGGGGSGARARPGPRRVMHRGRHGGQDTGCGSGGRRWAAGEGGRHRPK